MSNPYDVEEAQRKVTKQRFLKEEGGVSQDELDFLSNLGSDILPDRLRQQQDPQQIADLIGRTIANSRNQSQGGSGRSNGNGGQAAAPISTLAGLPQTPMLQELIAHGIIREGMPQEQALALMAIAKVKGDGSLDIQALMDMVRGTYESTTGDIESAGAQWMQQLYGTNFDPNDPNAAGFANDPLWSSYAGGLAQMGETSDQNLATDLSWFLKQGSAQDEFYNELLAGISSGAMPIGEGGSSGGGSGGGGGYGGGGNGNGNGGDTEWTDPKTTYKDAEVIQSKGTSNESANFPGWWNEVETANLAPEYQDFIGSGLSRTQAPKPFEQWTEAERDSIIAQLSAAGLVDESNAAWTASARPQFEASQQSLENQGVIIGDNPDTDDIRETFYQDPEFESLPGTPLPTEAEQMQRRAQEALMDRAYNPIYAPIQDRQPYYDMLEYGVPEPIESTAPNDVFMTQVPIGGGMYINVPSMSTNTNSNTEMGPANPAHITQAENAMTDPQARYFYLQDTYPNLPPASQAAVDQLFNSNGISTPGSHAEYNPIQSAAIARMQNALGQQPEEEAPPGSGLMQLLNIPGVQQARRRAMGMAISDYNDPLREVSGTLRPDLYEYMQDQSQLELAEAQANAVGDFEPPAGKYWNPNITPEVEIDEMERQLLYLTQAQQVSQLNNTNFNMSPYRDTLIDTGTETSTLQDTSSTYDPAAAALAGMPDPETVSLDELDLIEGDGTSEYVSWRGPAIEKPKPIAKKQMSVPVKSAKKTATPILKMAAANRLKKMSGGKGKF